MSSTDYVEFDVGQVKGPGLKTAEKSAFTELVRSLSSFGRAVVKHLPSSMTLLKYVQDAFVDAEATAAAELHLQNVAEGSNNALTTAAASDQQDFAAKAARIIVAKSKRLKQHARRAQARAKRSNAGSVQGRPEWPAALKEGAEDISNWQYDLFMHVAMLVVSKYIEDQGTPVNRVDTSRQKQHRKQVKKLIHFHGDSIGVQQFELKGFAFLSRETGLLVKPSEANQSFRL